MTHLFDLGSSLQSSNMALFVADDNNNNNKETGARRMLTFDSPSLSSAFCRLKTQLAHSRELEFAFIEFFIKKGKERTSKIWRKKIFFTKRKRQDAQGDAEGRNFWLGHQCYELACIRDGILGRGHVLWIMTSGDLHSRSKLRRSCASIRYSLCLNLCAHRVCRDYLLLGADRSYG